MNKEHESIIQAIREHGIALAHAEEERELLPDDILHATQRRRLRHDIMVYNIELEAARGALQLVLHSTPTPSNPRPSDPLDPAGGQGEGSAAEGPGDFFLSLFHNLESVEVRGTSSKVYKITGIGNRRDGKIEIGINDTE